MSSTSNFDPKRIENYQPNKTFWLPQKARKRMEKASAGSRKILDRSYYSQKIFESFMIDFKWLDKLPKDEFGDRITHILFNTKILIEHGKKHKSKTESKMEIILDYKEAMRHIIENLEKGMPNMQELLALHKIIARYSLKDDLEFLGSIRDAPVYFDHLRYVPSANPDELFTQQAMILAKAKEIENPFEASFFLKMSTSYLQAFGDGNKRLGRLLANIPLLMNGLPPISFSNLDSDQYIKGICDFFDQNYTNTMAKAISKNYRKNAPIFQMIYSDRDITPQNEDQMERFMESLHMIMKYNYSIKDAQKLISKLFKDMNQIKDINNAENISQFS